MKPTKEETFTRIKLTSKEKSELFFEALITIVLLILLNIAVLGVSRILVDGNQDLTDIIFGFKEVLFQKFLNSAVYSLGNLAMFFLIIIDIIVLLWRLIRRYHQMQMRHILNELHYIANGNYEHRIPFKLSGDLGKVISSINGLVTSTVDAIEEERRIEKSKDELITNISHDIRTPLTSIIGYLGLIEERRYQSEEELLRYTNTAYTKSKQMKVLVDDLFEYTKVRQPSGDLNIIQFDLHQLFEQLIVDFELESTRKKIKIDLISDSSPFMMEGDTEKLVRVFDNLITNALKYGRDGNQIQLIAEKVGSEAVITIKNDGSTIPQEALDLVFERFYRVERSRSQETGGSGLGLAIAQSIIVLHGGYIYVKSEDGWTSFIIHLPLKRINSSYSPIKGEV